MKKHMCAIIVLYDEDGMFDEYVFFLINEFREVCDRLIAVVNGNCGEKYYERLSKVCDDVILRENCGYDAGAYKHVLINYLSQNELIQYDELVFCNDTFFGPFASFGEIFEEMDKKPCDFWGIAHTKEWLDEFVHSYFLVFRKRIIFSNNLYTFFANLTDIESFADVGYYYERKLFEYLVQKGYAFSTLMGKQEYSIYRESNKNIEAGYPILKKKAFIKRNYEHEVIMHSLKQIVENTAYDVNLILDSVKRKLGIPITLEQIEAFTPSLSIDEPCERMISVEKTTDFIDAVENLYIYGVEGCITKIIMDKLKPQKLKGFIVSNGQKHFDYYEGYPVFEVGEFSCEDNAGIIVALYYQNSIQVRDNLAKFKNVLYLWEGM